LPLPHSCRLKPQAKGSRNIPSPISSPTKSLPKYQTSSCDQLKAQKQAPPNAQHEEMETKVIDLLKQNPPMRQHFLNRIAGPIVNKMFECGMIP
jgi:hypothetical protein